MSPQSAPKALSSALSVLLCPLFASSLRLFLLSGRFGTILASCWNPWDLKNIAFSLRRSSHSSFSLVSLRTQPWVTKFIPKGSKLPPQDAQKVPQRSPRALRRAPGESQEPPETTPRELLGYPWASKRSPGVVLGASGPHFGAPRAGFTYFSSLFQTFSSLFSSLFFLSFLVYVLVFAQCCLLLSSSQRCFLGSADCAERINPPRRCTLEQRVEAF